MKIQCPHCSQNYEVEAEYLGETVTCQTCGKDFVVEQPAPDISQQTVSCPYCGEQILAVAQKCKHCGEFLNRKRNTSWMGQYFGQLWVRKKKWVLVSLLAPVIIVCACIGIGTALRPQQKNITSPTPTTVTTVKVTPPPRQATARTEKRQYDDNITEEKQYDNNGNVIQVSYFGVGGKPCFCKDGFATVKIQYDHNGNVTQASYLGIDGKPCFHGKGFATWKIQYDDKGYRIEDSYFGVDGKPCLREEGYATVKLQYDSKGNAIQESYFGIDGKPCVPKANYMIIDLSGELDAAIHPVRYSSSPPDLKEKCRTTQLWLRRIPAGTFTMGSPPDEPGRYGNETQRQVTLTQDFYIGVFEVTQKQYELIMGANPSDRFTGQGMRPVEQVSYNMIRGAALGMQWPQNNDVDPRSFMGKLRAKTGKMFDLPTEAQWEYACRAGTTTALNSGKGAYHLSNSCPNMGELGRYKHNVKEGLGGETFGHTKVGMYEPNNWGLYDMHGNVWEWCLDWFISSPGTGSATDPKGPPLSDGRVIRGGSFGSEARDCRSAIRSKSLRDNNSNVIGFRICLTLSTEI